MQSKKNGRIIKWWVGLPATVVLLVGLLGAVSLKAGNNNRPHKPHVVFLISKDSLNYEADKTVPAFARDFEKTSGWKVTVVQAEGPRNAAHFPGLSNLLDEADVLVLFARRLALPPAEMAALKAYFKKGKSLVGIRTANHAFSVHDADKINGYEDWWDFVPDILGCLNKGYGPVEPGMEVKAVAAERSHPLLKGVPAQWHSNGNLYLVDFSIDPLARTLLVGSVEDKQQPVAWTRMAGNSKVFYTSLGYPDDFSDKAFTRLVSNAIRWAAIK